MPEMSDKRDLTRRQALKALAASAGGLALTLIPKGWKTPVISVGTLPVHAQVSGPEPTAIPAEPTAVPTEQPFCDGDMCAVATTTTLVEGETDPEYGDFDFSMCTPNGHYVWGGSSGDGGTSSPDNIDFDPHVDNETLDISTAVPGVYSVYLEMYEQLPLEMTVQIITAQGVHNTTLSLSQSRAVADVTFPGGTVTWRSDPGWPSCGGGDGEGGILGKK